MGCTACTEPQCLYKGALYLYLYVYTNCLPCKYKHALARTKQFCVPECLYIFILEVLVSNLGRHALYHDLNISNRGFQPFQTKSCLAPSVGPYLCPNPFPVLHPPLVTVRPEMLASYRNKLKEQTTRFTEEVRQWQLSGCLLRAAVDTRSVAFAACLRGIALHVFTHQLALFLIRILTKTR
jgi:hypothetical protein